jgi:hypothetical protein
MNPTLLLALQAIIMSVYTVRETPKVPLEVNLGSFMMFVVC